MSYASCPTAIVNVPVDIVWALLTDPAGWGHVFDVRINSVDPPGRAVAGQKIAGETGPRLFHLKLVFLVIETDAERHRLVMDIKLPFGIAVREDLKCTPLDADHCRVDYQCDFNFPKGWRGALTRMLLNREMSAGHVDSLSRLKRAAELRRETRHHTR
jgi:Polyketide cyclase / dehydrase and lipid transport